ncbi:hypothetical protein D9M68_620890 [compost metagenome]
MRQRRQPVQETGRRHGQANARLLREKAGNRCGVACVLLVTEADDAHAVGLRQTREIGDRNAGQAVDVFDAVQLERVDDQMKTIGLCLMFFRGVTLQFVSNFCHGCFLLYKVTGVGCLLFQGVFRGGAPGPLRYDFGHAWSPRWTRVRGARGLPPCFNPCRFIRPVLMTYGM